MIYELNGKRPQLCGDKHFIAPNAAVIGDVELGAEASVWFSVVIRGDGDSIKIGARTNIQDLSMLHVDHGVPLTIGESCTVGHKVILHGCEIGDRCLIGMGATVLNGAKIGDDCLIGAGALVTEGTEIPARSLVMGVPAKVVKPLSEAWLEKLKKSADGYVLNAEFFEQQLKPIVG